MFTVAHCSGHFEPFVLVHRTLFAKHRLPFDESFARGFDKVSFVYELYARNVTMRVAPGAYVLHLPGDGVDVDAAPIEAARPTRVQRLGRRARPVGLKPLRDAGTGEDVTTRGASATPFVPPPSAGAGCNFEPVQEYISPWAEMPGHTCIDRFLDRMAREFGYVPHGGDHNALRRWASRWRGRCHTDTVHMAGYMPRTASGWTRLPGLTIWDARAGGWRPNATASPLARHPAMDYIGFPRRRPRAVRVVGTWEPPHRLETEPSRRLPIDASSSSANPSV